MPRNAFRFFAGESGANGSRDIAAPSRTSRSPGPAILPFRQPVVHRIITKDLQGECAVFSGNRDSRYRAFPLAAVGYRRIRLRHRIHHGEPDPHGLFLAGASDRPVGYREQKAEIASVLVGAFGWRAIARELVGNIPLGGGLLPKAAIAYAGTRVVGMSMERYYRIGYGYTSEERGRIRAGFATGQDGGKCAAHRH